MNTLIIKSIPSGNFEEISIHIPELEPKFLDLVKQKKLIKYDVYTMPNISKAIQDELSKMGYCDQILEQDHSQHFLFPKPQRC